MNGRILKDAVGWGILLWFIGYILGFVLFALVPTAMIGWIIMPFAILITLWVLIRKIRGGSWAHFLVIAIVWTAIAVAFDYLFLVKLLKPVDGYYKLDVYLYYALTFVLPSIVGFAKGTGETADRTAA
jgi:hypothetical protein